VVLVGGKPPKTLAKGHVSSDSSGPVQTSWRLHITYHCHSVKAFFYNIIHTYIYIIIVDLPIHVYTQKTKLYICVCI
jgi:hypothetical protein